LAARCAAIGSSNLAGTRAGWTCLLFMGLSWALFPDALKRVIV
jgi:hypothetical protein